MICLLDIRHQTQVYSFGFLLTFFMVSLFLSFIRDSFGLLEEEGGKVVHGKIDKYFMFRWRIQRREIGKKLFHGISFPHKEEKPM